MTLKSSTGGYHASSFQSYLHAENHNNLFIKVNINKNILPVSHFHVIEKKIEKSNNFQALHTFPPKIPNLCRIQIQKHNLHQLNSHKYTIYTIYSQNIFFSIRKGNELPRYSQRRQQIKSIRN